jgi:hypothetical protein
MEAIVFSELHLLSTELHNVTAHKIQILKGLYYLRVLKDLLLFLYVVPGFSLEPNESDPYLQSMYFKT